MLISVFLYRCAGADLTCTCMWLEIKSNWLSYGRTSSKALLVKIHVHVYALRFEIGGSNSAGSTMYFHFIWAVGIYHVYYWHIKYFVSTWCWEGRVLYNWRFKSSLTKMLSWGSSSLDQSVVALLLEPKIESSKPTGTIHVHVHCITQ